MITLPSGRKIGEGQPAFIVAEIGSNWSTLEDCLNSISMAKACGADAVKFQLFTFKDLHGMHSYQHTELIADGKLIPWQLPPEWLPKLKEKADAVGIEFMCSAFSPELIDAVNPFVNIHKVASAECTHKRMLQKLRAIGKPVILSTGGHGIEDIRQALDVLGPTPTVLMYCVAAYPANMTNPRAVSDFQDLFPGVPIGFSDHSTEVFSTTWDTNACVIEKHVNFVGASGPDAPHSLSTDQFKALVAGGKHLPAWGGPVPEEKPMILRHNRRLIATRNIKAGEPLIEIGTFDTFFPEQPDPYADAQKRVENFGIFRSLKDDTHAYGPMMIDEVNGKIAKRDIGAGNGIGPGDV